jgi:hypothetical protein
LLFAPVNEIAPKAKFPNFVAPLLGIIHLSLRISTKLLEKKPKEIAQSPDPLPIKKQ